MPETEYRNDDSNKRLPVGALALRDDIVDILKENGFTYFSDIQGKVIPKMLKHIPVIGLALTGTGKTLSYVLPIVNSLKDDGHVQAVVLSPTVALLDQVKKVFEMFTLPLGFPKDAVKVIKGNNDFSRAKPDVILTTPSLLDEMRSHYPVNELNRIIIDEGDMIAFDGFVEQLYTLKKATEQKQVSFFSASLNIQDIKKVKRMFHIDTVIDVRDSSITNQNVTHHLVNHRGFSKDSALLSFLKFHDVNEKTIVFVSKKDDLFSLSNVLKENKIAHQMLFGDMDKREIRKTIDSFASKEKGLLLASDYASRGIDVPTVTSVISVDLPKDLAYYFHRSGRAGRFDKEGESYVFYDEDDKDSVNQVKALIRRNVSFDHYILSDDSLRKTKEKYQFKNLGKKDQSNDLLQKQIRHAVNETKSNKVKPGYKKKVKRAVDRVKMKHRMKVVRTNIAKSGGNANDFHVDIKRSTKKK